mmetsp:Transcript_32140/g.102376  ORF Transcript_32140/g.102376 Transcript_32140/m.102376 type:complete len:82 (-) Transcript_32140:3073-3318(-)
MPSLFVTDNDGPNDETHVGSLLFHSLFSLSSAKRVADHIATTTSTPEWTLLCTICLRLVSQNFTLQLISVLSHGVSSLQRR